MGLSRLYPQHPSWFLERTPVRVLRNWCHPRRPHRRRLRRLRIETVTLRGCATSPMSPAIGFCQGSPMQQAARSDRSDWSGSSDHCGRGGDRRTVRRRRIRNGAVCTGDRDAAVARPGGGLAKRLHSSDGEAAWNDRDRRELAERRWAAIGRKSPVRFPAGRTEKRTPRLPVASAADTGPNSAARAPRSGDLGSKHLALPRGSRMTSPQQQTRKAQGAWQASGAAGGSPSRPRRVSCSWRGSRRTMRLFSWYLLMLANA